MATNMPVTIPELINWCSTHTSLWTANATQIGISAAQATAFNTLVANFNKANSDAQAARQNSKDATMTLASTMDAVRSTGNAYIFMIKAYAETTHNPAVFSLAGVSPNDPPSVVPAPIAPANFSAGVNTDGSLTIKWKVSQPEGVTNVQYIVFRRLGGPEAPFVMLSTEGKNKSFTDLTLPLGVDRVEYMVQPKRGEVLGPQSNVFALQFGSVAGGGGISIADAASVPHAEPMKIAA
jgi:hypothetical protein